MALIRPLPFFTFALFLFCACKPEVVASVKVILGEPFEFPKNCQTGETGSLRHRFSPGRTRKVAAFEAGVWTASSGYTGRISGNSSIIFDRVVFNDNGGTYEITCEKPGVRREEIVQLEVVEAHHVSVPEGGTAVLACHYITTGKTGLIVRWGKDGGELFEKRLGSRDDEPASGRMYISPDWSSDGNLSLIIEGVQEGDQGLYTCSVTGDEDGDNARAIKMTVSKNQFSSTSAAPTQTQETCTEERRWFIWGILLGFVLCFIMLGGLWLCLCRRSASEIGRCCPSTDVEEQLEPRSPSLTNKLAEMTSPS